MRSSTRSEMSSTVAKQTPGALVSVVFALDDARLDQSGRDEHQERTHEVVGSACPEEQCRDERERDNGSSRGEGRLRGAAPQGVAAERDREEEHEDYALPVGVHEGAGFPEVLDAAILRRH